MKTDVRLNSAVKHGVGSSAECHAIELIYIYLLGDFGLNVYRHIGINQVGNDLNEFVMNESGNKIHCNIRYPVFTDFEEKNVDERNKIRLDVIHAALLRIAETDKKLDTTKLKKIRQKIIDKNFNFEIPIRNYVNKNKPNLSANLLVHPQIDKFDFYIAIEEDKELKCKVHIYAGRTGVFFGSDFFSIGKWKKNQLIITGKRKEVEIRISADDCDVEFINLTSYSNPPWFTVMKANVSDEERDRAYKDWLHSLPPAIASALREANN